MAKKTAKKITKAEANKAAAIVAAYAKQQSVKAARIGAKKTGRAVKAGSKVVAAKSKVIAKKGFSNLKKLFS